MAAAAPPHHPPIVPVCETNSPGEKGRGMGEGTVRGGDSSKVTTRWWERESGLCSASSICSSAGLTSQSR